MATILIDKNVMVPMRDGVRLATDVYRLDDAPPAPVLQACTPYDKEHTVADSTTFDVLRAVHACCVLVIKDVRGRSASDGSPRWSTKPATAWTPSRGRPASRGRGEWWAPSAGRTSVPPNGCPPGISLPRCGPWRPVWPSPTCTRVRRIRTGRRCCMTSGGSWRISCPGEIQRRLARPAGAMAVQSS